MENNLQERGIQTGQLAFLTMANLGDFVVTDQLTYPALENLGWSVTEVPWTAADTDWNRFAAVIIRSSWDYQQHLDDFLDALERIEHSGTRLLNSLECVRWNIEKTYLRIVEKAGVPIVPTKWFRGLQLSDLETAFDDFVTDELITKPVVGANADNVFRHQRHRLNESIGNAQRAYETGIVMVQPFLQSVVSEGEYSLIYFGGQLSHALLKAPAANDFRVQEEHGGSVRPVEAGPDLKRIGKTAMESVPFDTLYARVDLVKLNSGDYAVIEIELIEPSLYFSCDNDSPARFAKTLDEWLR